MMLKTDASKEQLQLLQHILDQHDLWLKTHNVKGQRAYLGRTNLSKLDLSRVNLSNASLYRVKLIEACLDNAKFQHSDIIESNLRHASLQDTDLSNADMYRVDLTFANLLSANLSDTNLHYADLRGAKFDHGILKCRTLEKTTWLKTDIPWYIQHPGYAKWGHTIRIVNSPYYSEMF